jgi:RP/EB family microtubule-associated protein
MAGIMDPHYFLSKADLLGWINETLSLRLSKVEDTANGAVACQIMDALHPGMVPFKKLDFNAKNEYDMINNYKVLQEVFNKLGIAKHIEVAKLIKAKPLDNIEFMQWLKSYFDGVTNNTAITDYDGPGKRAQCKTGDLKGPSAVGGGKPAMRSSALIGNSPAGPRRPAVSVTNGSPAARMVQGGGSELAVQLAEVRATLDMVEKEKQFYYSKLRDVELLCQTPTVNELPIMKRVEAILYAPTAEDGRQILMDTQQEFAGCLFLEEDEAAAQAEAEAAQ